MSIDVDGLKARTDIVSVITAYTALKKVGNEYCGPCPIHGGDGDNFYVNPRKRIWSCFSRGCHECDEGNDVIGFLRKMEGLTFQQACERLGATNEWKPAATITQKAVPQPDRITSKPPAGVKMANMEMRGLGVPVKTWEYLDAQGELLGYVARYEISAEEKQFRCWTWGARGAESPQWGCGHWNKPHPLYGLDRLAKREGAPVLIVEGEKAADAAQELLGQMVVVTWPGGANAWKNADFSPLAGRSVLLWPDNDIAGLDAMGKLAPILADPKGLKCRVRTLDPTGMPEGYDAADWDGTSGDLITWSKTRIQPFEVKAPQPETAPPIEAYSEDAARAPVTELQTRKPKKPKLAVVEGNTVRAPEEDDEPLPQAMSEDALGSAFADEISPDWRYVHEWLTWFEWSGDFWREDKTKRIDHLAVQLTRRALYWDEAKSLTPKERRAVNKRSTAGAVRDIAATDRRIAATIDQWDKDSFLLGVPGGVMDLKAGQFLPAESSQYITKRCAVAPANGKPERWLEYLKRCHSGNEEIISYLQRYAGYSCTGETGEHALAFLYGTGRNGKGIFLETVSRILGDYAATASIETFLERKNPAHTTELARLHKARLVITEEAGAGGKWNESRIKHMTGGGKITARFMRTDDIEFVPNFKLLIASNHRPSMKSVDEAMKARIHLVPFNVTIPLEERDPHLLAKLESEWPQILGWMLDGCSEWQRQRLSPPAIVIDATREYMESEDILGDWIAANCSLEGECDAADGYRNYKSWCDAQGHQAWSRIGWSRALLERGGIDSRRTNGRTIVLGLSLKPQQF